LIFLFNNFKLLKMEWWVWLVVSLVIVIVLWVIYYKFIRKKSEQVSNELNSFERNSLQQDSFEMDGLGSFVDCQDTMNRYHEDCY